MDPGQIGWIGLLVLLETAGLTTQGDDDAIIPFPQVMERTVQGLICK